MVVGEPFTIRWSAPPSVANVSIWLYGDSADDDGRAAQEQRELFVVGEIVAAAPNTQEFMWTPPRDLDAHPAYAIVVFAAGARFLYASSASFVLERAGTCAPGSFRAATASCELCPKGTYVRTLACGTTRRRTPSPAPCACHATCLDGGSSG